MIKHSTSLDEQRLLIQVALAIELLPPNPHSDCSSLNIKNSEKANNPPHHTSVGYFSYLQSDTSRKVSQSAPYHEQSLKI